MRSTKMVGVCLIAMFAVSAFAMSATSAYAGEYGQCTKLAKAKGKYTDSNCTKLAEKKGKPVNKGAYEFVAGPSPSCVAQKKGEYTNSGCTEKSAKAHKGSFEREPCYGTGNGCAEYKTESESVTLESGKGNIVCAKSTGTGVITGVKTGDQTVNLEHCELPHVGACTSLQVGEPAGDITTYQLETTLIDHGEKGLGGHEPVEGEVWNQYANLAGAHAPFIAQFDCPGAGFLENKGYLSGPITPVNVSTTAFTSVLEKGVAEQGIEATGCSSETFEHCAPFEAGYQKVVGAKQITNEAIEVKP
jgi:hypothetical protein